jgi:2-C-methyl-D-erythritol 4-phosphate cytidylyltransferase
MIIVAGGTSSRFGGDKLMAMIAGQPLIAHTIAAIAPHVDACVLVGRKDQVGALRQRFPSLTVVGGGDTRTQSELAGLGALVGEFDLIGIHDGARPLISPSLIEALFEVAAGVGGAVPILETSQPIVRRSDLSPVHHVAIVQTPQVFHGPALQAAYRAASAHGFEGHDTADVVRSFSELRIAAVEGDPTNIKVTYESDLAGVIETLDPARSEPL